MLDLNTFGASPAAEYLARTLNKLDNSTLTRNISRSIAKTATQVAELVTAYDCGNLSAKTVANSLRLMRTDVSQFAHDSSMNPLIVKLAVNIQIAHIKRAMRMCVVAARSQRVMADPYNRGRVLWNPEIGANVVRYVEGETGMLVVAGYIHNDPILQELVTVNQQVGLEEVQVISDELLHARSAKRCIRLKKAHTL
jgi:hypothetical protein